VQQSANPKETSRLIIKGLTDSGHKFRPSDWAERLCGHLSTFRNRRIYFSRLLKPAVIDGIKCVIVDSSLAEVNPKVFQMVMDFACTNHLDQDWQKIVTSD